VGVVSGHANSPESLDGLMASRHFHQAAIMGRAGGILAIYPGFGVSFHVLYVLRELMKQLSQSEQDAIVRMFSGPYNGRGEALHSDFNEFRLITAILSLDTIDTHAL
jgi:hypothetical protein